MPEINLEILSNRIAQFVLANYEVKEKTIISKTPDMELLKTLVCEEFHITVDELDGKLRKRSFVDARKMYAYITKEKYAVDMPVSQIGEHINKDHSSVLYYIESARDLLKQERRFKEHYENLLKLLA